MPRFFKCLGSLASADQARDKSDIIEGFKYAIDGDSEMGWSMDKLTVRSVDWRFLGPPSSPPADVEFCGRNFATFRVIPQMCIRHDALNNSCVFCHVFFVLHWHALSFHLRTARTTIQVEELSNTELSRLTVIQKVKHRCHHSVGALKLTCTSVLRSQDCRCH